MNSNKSLINELLDILYNLETNGNPHPDFLKATKLIAKNWNLSELFLLIRRSFIGNEPEQLSYWLYSSKQLQKPGKGKKHNIVEISYSESISLKSIREKKESAIFINQDDHFTQMIKNMAVIKNNNIDITAKYFGHSLNYSNDKEGFVILKDSEKETLDDPEWISVKKICCLMINKIFNAYSESNKIKDMLSKTANNLLEIQNPTKNMSKQDDVLQEVLDVTRKAVKAETGALFLVDSSGSSLVLERISSDSKLIYENIPQVPTYLIKNFKPEIKRNGVTPWVWYRQKPFNARDFYELIHNSEGQHKGNWDNLMYGGNDKAPDNFKCAYMTPLQAGNECIGVLKYENRTKDAVYNYFDQSDERTINITAQFIANLVISQRIEKNRYDKALPEISKTLISSFGKPDFYDELLEKSRSILNAQTCSLFLLDKDQSLKLKAIVGIDEDIKKQLKDFSYTDYSSSHGLTPWILRENRSFNSRTFADLEARSEKHHWGKWDDIVYHGEAEKKFKSLYSIPLKIGEEPIGVFKVENKITIPFYFTESDERMFDLIGRLIAIVVKYERDLQFGDTLKAAEIGFLSTGIAHEFNNYLQSFIGNIDLIKLEIDLIKLESEDSINQTIEDLEKSVFMASNVIENFKHIRERENKVITFDSDSLVKELLNLSEQKFKKDKVELFYSNNLGNKNITFNQAGFQTIVVNLLSNAYDSIIENKSSGEILLTVGEKAANLIIQVEDSGIGIDENDLKIIFSPFYSFGKKKKGMGIGLFLVQQIVFQNRGNIKVDGNNRRGGATFTVTLPKNI